MLQDARRRVLLTRAEVVGAGRGDRSSAGASVARIGSSVGAVQHVESGGGVERDEPGVRDLHVGFDWEPKGIAVMHRGVVRLVKNTDYVQLRPGDRFAQTSDTSFDASTFEVWGALLNGGG